MGWTGNVACMGR